MGYARFNRQKPVAERCWPAMWVYFALGFGGCAHSPVHQAPVVLSADGQTAAGARPAAVRFVSPYTYEWFIRAELFVAQGDLAQAADAYRRALAGADEDPLVVARLALTLDAMGEAEDAQAQLAHGDTLDPESEAIWLARGEIAERHADRATAIAAYQRAQDFAPHSARPTLALARLLSDAPERALAVLRQFRLHNERWQPQRIRVELAIALREHDLTRAVEGLNMLRAISFATALETEAVARLAFDQQRRWLARELLGEVSDRIVDRALWLRVSIAAGDVTSAKRVLAQATIDELGGMDAMAGYYLALGDAERAAELAALSLARGASDSATVTLLRATGLHALAAEVERTRP
jgi:Tfp pilus assembly protein PilF